MAKKIGDNEKNAQMYPWLRLLELEVQPQQHAAPRRGRGRPTNPFPRKPVHVTLTDRELAALDDLVGQFSERFGQMYRGHLIAFLVLLLHSRLAGQPLPPEIKTLTSLASYLEKPQ